MVKLNTFPANREKFVRLLEFLKEVLDICKTLGIDPIVDGGLAVFAYTQNKDLVVNDVDLSVSEGEFPGLVKTLEDRGINYKLREWHVLQVLRGDLKIELGSMEFWYKEMPVRLETLEIDNYKVRMLTPEDLKALYKKAMEDRAKKVDQDENERVKYERLKEKFEMLERFGGNRSGRGIRFRKLTEEDLPLMLKWLNTPHVVEWYEKKPSTIDGVRAKYVPRITGVEPTKTFLMIVDEEPIGYIQEYYVKDDREINPYVRGKYAGIDLFIGEEAYLGKKLGEEVIREFLRQVVFTEPEVDGCVADPSSSNARMIHVLEKVGFKYLATTNGDDPKYLMTIARNEFLLRFPIVP